MTDAHRTIVHVDRVTKHFGSTTAVDAVDIEIRENEFFALLGPSGCGKTTLLRMLAGFEVPDAGRILLDGADVARVPPYRRPFNMMFQSYALFPHMSVNENVAYGLRQDGVAPGERERRVAEILELVQLGDLGERRPHQLSGGQRSRVALARALVKRPRLLLLDEPLAALDRKLRSAMQFELKQLQEQVGITFVVVTHDQEEALVMADRAAIMDHGRVLQLDAPSELYEHPATRFVAGFVGESNALDGTLEGAPERPILRTALGELALDGTVVRRSGLTAGMTATLIVRPERIRFAGPDPVGSGTVVEVAYLGSSRRLVLTAGAGERIVARIQAGQPGEDLVRGATVDYGWDPAQVALVPSGPVI